MCELFNRMCHSGSRGRPHPSRAASQSRPQGDAPRSGALDLKVNPAESRQRQRQCPSPLRPELPAAPTMLVAEHGRAPHSPAGWQIAVVVLRYFVAVLILRRVAKNQWEVHRRHRRVWGPVGLEPKIYGLRERPAPTRKACDRPFRLVDVEVSAALLDRAALQWNHPSECLEAHAQAGDLSEDPLWAADHPPRAHVVL